VTELEILQLFNEAKRIGGGSTGQRNGSLQHIGRGLEAKGYRAAHSGNIERWKGLPIVAEVEGFRIVRVT
jgi:hypothetical protein